MAGRVPAAYLKVAFWVLLSFLPFRRINKLRITNVRAGFDSPRLHHRSYYLPVISIRHRMQAWFADHDYIR